jgi:hypothetical protein
MVRRPYIVQIAQIDRNRSAWGESVELAVF